MYFPFVIAPSYTPATPGVGAMVNVLPSGEISVTLLNVEKLAGTVTPNPEIEPSFKITWKEFCDNVVWYLIIDPTFTPIKFFPALVTVFDPLMVSSVTPFGKPNFSRTQSAVNCENPVDAFCCTDLISSVEYALTDLIVLEKSIPLTINCSPTLKVPEVWLKLIVVEFPPAATTKPLAPLLFPFTKEVFGNSVFDTSEFKTRVVYVWISYKYKLKLVEAFL